MWCLVFVDDGGLWVGGSLLLHSFGFFAFGLRRLFWRFLIPVVGCFDCLCVVCLGVGG